MPEGFDRRLTPARADLAAAHLEGRVAAPRYVRGRTMRVAAPVLSMSPSPARDVSIDTQALCGEAMTVYDYDDEGWAWGQLDRDGYVGYVPSAGLRADLPGPTHVVAVPRTILYPAPTIKYPSEASLPLGAEVTTLRQTGDFAELLGHGFVFAAHLVPVDHTVGDFVGLAEQFLHAPYLWGGKTSAGIDCSGLVQVAMQAAGVRVPRDTDLQQAGIGAPVDIGEDLAGLRRGDLVFWKGHVGIMRDGAMLLHASGHHMLVVTEPLAQARDRIRQATGGNITAVRRA